MSTPRRSSRRRRSGSPRAPYPLQDVSSDPAPMEMDGADPITNETSDVTSPSLPAASSFPGSDLIKNGCAADGYRAFLENQGAADSSDLQKLERQLERAIDTLWQSAVLVENFTEQSQEKIFHANIRKYMACLSSISKIASSIDIEIPVRVLTKIDSGGNPDLVTKELAEVCAAKNDETRGRIFCTRLFRDIFKAEIEAWNERNPLN